MLWKCPLVECTKSTLKFVFHVYPSSDTFGLMRRRYYHQRLETTLK